LVYEDGITGFLFVAAVRCCRDCEEEMRFIKPQLKREVTIPIPHLSLSQKRNFAVCLADQYL
jgi:hypothetical protein